MVAIAGTAALTGGDVICGAVYGGFTGLEFMPVKVALLWKHHIPT